MDRNFFRDVPHGPKAQPRKDAVRGRIIAMRKRNLSVYDIRDELERVGKDRLSITAIQEVLRQEGFSRLPRRLDEERPNRPGPMADAVADVRMFSLDVGEFSTHVGGVFMLLPLLARLDLDAMVARCRFPGTKMIPAEHAVRAALLLKLLGKYRRSHVMDLVFDPGVALAAGLNAIPKATFMSQYSSRLGRKAIPGFLGSWVQGPHKAQLPDRASFYLAFHSISSLGDDPLGRTHS